jgi:LysM repeat protein
MPIGLLRRVRPNNLIILATLALVLSGCFQTAGDAIFPTAISLTSIAASPTPFITPISTGGFIPPTDDPNVPTSTPLAPPTDVLPTATIEQALVPPTEMPTVETAGGQETPIPPTASDQLPSETPVEGLPQPTNDSALNVPSTSTSAPLLPTPTALATEGPCVHTVQPGEWALSIARKYNVSLEDLLAANPTVAANPDSLAPGDVLNVPHCGPAEVKSSATGTSVQTAQAPASTPNTTPATPIQVSDRIYTVVSGDSLGTIARKFNTTVKVLVEINGLTSDALSVGQVLKLPK